MYYIVLHMTYHLKYYTDSFETRDEAYRVARDVLYLKWGDNAYIIGPGMHAFIRQSDRVGTREDGRYPSSSFDDRFESYEEQGIHKFQLKHTKRSTNGDAAAGPPVLFMNSLYFARERVKL